MLVTPINSEGDRHIFQMGTPLGFHLLNDFEGLNYNFFGIFTALRPESVIWRAQMLMEIIDGRRSAIGFKLLGIGSDDEHKNAVLLLDTLLGNVGIWIMVTTKEDKELIEQALKGSKYNCLVYSMDDVYSELDQLTKSSM
jgi:hypothetical protein